MEPNEQSSPPEDFYQQQLQYAERVFFGSIDPVTPQSMRITRPLIYGAAGQIQDSDYTVSYATLRPSEIIDSIAGQVITVTDGTPVWRSTTKVGFEEMGEYQEDQIPSKSLFARIKIQKEKRKRKK